MNTHLKFTTNKRLKTLSMNIQIYKLAFSKKLHIRTHKIYKYIYVVLLAICAPTLFAAQKDIEILNQSLSFKYKTCNEKTQPLSYGQYMEDKKWIQCTPAIDTYAGVTLLRESDDIFCKSRVYYDSKTSALLNLELVFPLSAMRQLVDTFSYKYGDPLVNDTLLVKEFEEASIKSYAWSDASGGKLKIKEINSKTMLTGGISQSNEVPNCLKLTIQTKEMPGLYN
jgi:hypothetical protein